MAVSIGLVGRGFGPSSAVLLGGLWPPMAPSGIFNGAKFAAALRTYRKMKRLTQPQLSQLLGVGKGQIVIYENPTNTTVPDHDTVIRLIRALGAPVFEFLDALGYPVEVPAADSILAAAQAVVDRLNMPGGQKEMIAGGLHLARSAVRPESQGDKQAV